MHFVVEEYIINEIMVYKSEKFPGLIKNIDQKEKSLPIFKRD